MDPNDPPGALARRLDALLTRAVDRGRYVRHGLLAVARVDGAWEWQGAYGVADAAGTTVTTTSRYPIASITKMYTAAVTMLLIEQGGLALTDRMVDILPAATARGLHVRDGVDRTDEITVQHLLGHTSGLPDYYEEAPRGGRSAQARLLAGEDAPVPFDEVIRLVRDELRPHFPPQPPDSPSARARYSDTNYQLLGAVLQAVTGRPLADLFEILLLEPLGLETTSAYPRRPRSGADPAPQVDVWAKDTVLKADGALRHQVPDGGIISTLEDQVQFLRALAGSRVFADPTTWARMHARTHRVFFPIRYGLGVMQYAPSRWMSPGFRVPPLVGHSGSTATWLFHCDDLGVVLAGAFDVAQPSLPFRFLGPLLRAVQIETAADARA